MVESQQLTNVAGDRCLGRDDSRDLAVDLALQLVDFGVLPTDLVGQLRIPLDEGAARSLERLLDARSKAQHVVLDLVELPIERRAGPRALRLERRLVDRRIAHGGLLLGVDRPLHASPT